MSTSETTELATRLAALRGVPFAKMTGSGNDFVFFDAREAPLAALVQPDVIRAICHRFNGVGADGIVVLEAAAPVADARIHYFNSDGSPADLCGNATLCSTALAAEVGLGAPTGMRLLTGAGLVESRMRVMPAIDLQPVDQITQDMPIELGTSERRVGFARAGIPHLVVLCDSVTALEAIDLTSRGPVLRHHAAVGTAGANVNWVARMPDGRTWRYRTFERGVEGETLACGTGSVATAALLTAWGWATTDRTTLRTSSGRDLTVTFRESERGRLPTLEGEGRVVFRGQIGSLSAD